MKNNWQNEILRDTNELGWQTDKVSKYGISFSASEAL